jgi:plasmid stabilization system protein ParE
MNKIVIWSDRAITEYRNTILYLLDNWSEKEALNLRKETDRQILRIITHTQQFAFISKKRKVRKCVITKHNTLFFRETAKEIQIISFFDTRQHSSKLQIG